MLREINLFKNCMDVGDVQVKDYPRTCVWEVTMGCNMRCKHCGSSCEFPLPGELNTLEAFDFIDMCSDIGMEWINLSGGEPLTRKDLPKLIEHIYLKGMYVNIITNGWLIDENTSDFLSKFPYLRVVISVDGLKDIHDSIRKPGAFEHVEKAFDVLNSRDILTGCITTVTNRNIDCLNDIKDFLISKKVDSWQLQIGLPMGNLSDHDEWVIKPFQINDIIEFCCKTSNEYKIKVYPADCIGYFDKRIEKIYEKSFGSEYDVQWQGCNAGLRSFGILHNGDIVGCTSMRSREFIEGNIKERSLREIWENPNGFLWRRNFNPDNLGGDCKICKYSKRCLGGCPNTRLSMNGDICSENLYCTYNLKIKDDRKK